MEYYYNKFLINYTNSNIINLYNYWNIITIILITMCIIPNFPWRNVGFIYLQD